MSTQAVSTVKHFQPPSVQNYNAKEPKYAHRFIDTSPNNKRGDRLRYWQSQGWEIAPYGNEGMKGNRSTGATSDDGAVHYRGLVLIRILKEAADARNDFYRNKHKRLIEASQVARSLSALAGQRKNGDTNTSAFGHTVREQDRGGRRVTVHESEMDTRRGTSSNSEERIMRDADPAALKELNDRMAEMQENQKKLAAANEELRRELAEKKKRPSDRSRKTFPVS